MSEPIDEKYLTRLALARQSGSGPGSYDSCPSCFHGWHGLACTVLCTEKGVSYKCGCLSSVREAS